MGKIKEYMEISDILERLRKSESIRIINKKIGIHRTIIREVRDLANEQGWLDPSSKIPSEYELMNTRRFPADSKRHPLYRFYDDIKRWVEKDYTFTVIHQLIKDKYTCSESTVRRFVHEQFPKKLKPTAVRNAIAGRVMEVDFGYVGLLYDPISRRNRKAW